MAYQALYRKYRPQRFDQMVGQEAILKTLRNQLRTGRISHAYLFCGTRGTGKTSTAKIFAKAINCLDPQDGEPCGKCSLCQAMEEGRSVNVMEIDAASNNGVDNIRDIREEVKYPPTEGKYKIYIIDEVHMLSTGAFNALLKTLEEPPEHVIFILATTDPQKVPATILSRCQRFDFRRISAAEIAATLRSYVEQEGAKATDEALHTIATLADGSLRDSLSILDQCLAFFFDEELTEEKVLDIAGAVDRSIFFALADGLRQKQIQTLLELVDEVVTLGREIPTFTAQLVEHFRSLLIAATVEEGAFLLDVSGEQFAALKTQAETFSPEELTYYIRRFSALLSELKYSQSPRVLMEVELITLCAPSESTDSSSILARLSMLERQIQTGVVVQAAPAQAKKPSKPKKERPKALPEDVQAVISHWDDWAGECDTVSALLLKDCQPVYMEDGKLTVVCKDETKQDIIKKRLPQLQETIDGHLEKEMDVKTITETDYKAWEELTYGGLEEETPSSDDPDFDSLMRGYFPEAEIQE